MSELTSKTDSQIQRHVLEELKGTTGTHGLDSHLRIHA